MPHHLLPPPPQQQSEEIVSQQPQQLDIFDSNHLMVSKLEITPTPGFGFGGIGIGPSRLMPMPFGGFGMGFQIRNTPPEPTNEEILDVTKQKLQAVRQYEQLLENQIDSMEQQPTSTKGVEQK